MLGDLGVQHEVKDLDVAELSDRVCYPSQECWDVVLPWPGRVRSREVACWPARR